MARWLKRASQKVGLPPGTLVHVGEQKTAAPEITLLDYNQEHFSETDLASLPDPLPPKPEASVRWINVAGIHQVEMLETLGRQFGLHPLVLEDVLHTEQRPKVEDFGDYMYIVLRMVAYDEQQSEVTTEQISLILGRDFVLSFEESPSGAFDAVREHLRAAKGRIRQMGADYLAYALLDLIVDNYFVALEKLGEQIEDVEDELVAKPSPAVLQTLHAMRRELIYLRKAVWPLREVVTRLGRGESVLIQANTTIYLRDVYDHTVQVIETVETLRDMLAEMLEVYLSSQSNRLSEVMKVLTIIGTIFMPLTFIAGLYGMNFRYMPELGMRWAYPALLVVMLGIGVSMLFYFRRRGWL